MMDLEARRRGPWRDPIRILSPPQAMEIRTLFAAAAALAMMVMAPPAGASRGSPGNPALPRAERAAVDSGEGAARAWRLGLTAVGHARAADSLKRLGYRPLTLDAYGDPAAPRFASAWIRRGGPAWTLFHGISGAALGDSLAAWSRKGRRPLMLAALGAERGESFAAVVAADTQAHWTLPALDRAAFRKACDSAQRAGYRPAWVDAYGSAEDPHGVRFACIFERNLPAVPWNYSLGDDAESLEGKAATFAPVWVRPSGVVPLPGGKLLTLWQEGSVGPWTLRAAVPAAEAAALLAADAAGGRHPLVLSGTRRGGEDAFTVLSAGRAAALPRGFTVTGPESPGLEAFDAYVERLMRAHQVRAGALAMVKDGRLVLAKGYTYAEAGYPLTQPNSLFRAASCSKPLTSMAIHRMLDEGGEGGGRLSLREKVLSRLVPGGVPADRRFSDITVDDLLSHSAGWERSPQNPDPVFNDYPAGHAIRKRLPAAAGDFLSYMLGQPLQFAPGSRSSYANFGYFLLGRILGTLPHGFGRTYEEAMAALVFKPLGLSRPRLGGSLLAERQAGEVLYHTRYPYLQRGREPGGPAWVPGAYGDFDLRNMEAAGAWVLAATDFAKVLASFDLGEHNPVLRPEAVRTMWAPPHDPRYLRGWFATRLGRKQAPGRPAPEDSVAKWHNGLFPGTSTLVYYRPDRWSFALFLNRDIAPHLTGDAQGRELGRLADQVEAWPERDLFPEMGIQAFALQGVPGKSGPAPERVHYSTAAP